MDDGQPPEPTINQAFDEFLADQERRLAPRTYRKYENVIDLLRYCLEGDVIPLDRELEHAVKEARQAGREDAVCSVCPPDEIVGRLEEFFGWFMVRKVLAGQDLMQVTGTVVRRLGRWLYEHDYIDEDGAEYFEQATGGQGRALPKATALRDRLAEWVDNQPAARAEKTYEDHFDILAITPQGWQIQGLASRVQDVVQVPSHLVHSQQVGWEVSGVIAQTSRGLRWVEVWNVYP